MRKPIRVLYEIHPNSFGGTERFLTRFLGRLDRRRFEPLAVSPNAGHPLVTLKTLGVPAFVVPGYFTARGRTALAELIHRERITLVQSNYYSSALAIAASSVDAPHLWRLGGHVDVGSGARTAADREMILSMIRLLSDGIVCNSRYVRRQFHHAISRPPIVVISNGVERMPAPVRRRRTALCVGMVAHFTPQKRHEDFIAAAEIVGGRQPAVSFAILGGEYPHAESRRYARAMRARAGALTGGGRLHFGEFDGSVSEALGGLDAVVLPSVGESFSNAVLEAMAVGLPVIAARSGGNVELIEHRKSGLLVPPMRPDLLARALLTLLDDRDRMARMGQEARRRARAEFSLDDCVRRYEAEYLRIVSEPR